MRDSAGPNKVADGHSVAAVGVHVELLGGTGGRFAVTVGWVGADSSLVTFHAGCVDQIFSKSCSLATLDWRFGLRHQRSSPQYGRSMKNAKSPEDAVSIAVILLCTLGLLYKISLNGNQDSTSSIDGVNNPAVDNEKSEISYTTEV